MTPPPPPPRRWRQRLAHSIQWRLLGLFLLLAVAMSAAFLFGMQKALGAGWRAAARPLLVDYVDRLAAEIGSPPSVARAQALAERLPLTVRISGPQVNWQSHPGRPRPHRRLETWAPEAEDPAAEHLLSRLTADGHRIDFGLSVQPWRERPRAIGWATLVVLLVLTLGAWAVVRRLLRPLADIRAGARRFGTGDFSQPIALRRRDELADLAADVNAMAASIHHMLEAKRALLLAISHELRSPLTRARLNSELLPEDGDTGTRRAALLRDLQEMATLVTDLLESERLGAGHPALHLETVDPLALAREALAALALHQPGHGVRLLAPEALPPLRLDPARMRLLLRNLLDNALRHSAGAPQPPVLRLALQGDAVAFCVQDHGLGVPPEALPHLAEPFYRPDSARARQAGGVGLGLYLCRLVAEAHGGRLRVRNGHDGHATGLEVCAALPVAGPAAAG